MSKTPYDRHECFICHKACNTKLSCNHYYHRECFTKRFIISNELICGLCKKQLAIQDLKKFVNTREYQISEIVKDRNIIEFIYGVNTEQFTQTLFNKSVIMDNITMVKFLIDKRFHYNINFAIENACINGSVDMIKCLNIDNILANMDKSFVNEMLWKSVISNNEKLVEYIITYYKSCSKIDREETRLTYYATFNKNLKMLQVLVNAKFKVHDRLIKIAILNNDVGLINYIYSSIYSTPYIFTQGDVKSVIKYGYHNILEYIQLIQPELFIDIITNINLAYDNLDTFKYLYNLGAIVNETTVENLCLNPKCPIINYLININAIFTNQALENLCNNGDYHHVLTVFNANINFTENHFDILCKMDQLASIELLVEHKCHGTQNALDAAIINNSVKMIKLLIKSGYKYTYSRKLKNRLVIDSKTEILDLVSIF